MLFQNSLFLQAAVFSAVALGVIIASIWFFYFSPLRKLEKDSSRPTTGLAVWLAGLLGLAALLWVVGALWDASMHIETGEVPGGSDFLWPPHLMIYSGFLISLMVALVSIGKVAQAGWRAGQRDPRRWVRRNPFLGAVALASIYELMAIPGDAIWHELFGEDLTAWSPPHILLGVMSAVVILCAVGVILQTRPVSSRTGWREAVVFALLGLMLNLIYIIGVLEWELPVRPSQVDARPIWYYPLVGGSIAFFTLILARWLAKSRWAATITALAFYLIRFVVTALLSLTDNISPAIPLVFILGAFLMDILPWKQIKSRVVRGFALAAAFTAGYIALALPLLSLRDNLPPFKPLDTTLSVITTLFISLLILPLAYLAGRKLQGKPISA